VVTIHDAFFNLKQFCVPNVSRNKYPLFSVVTVGVSCEFSEPQIFSILHEIWVRSQVGPCDLCRGKLALRTGTVRLFPQSLSFRQMFLARLHVHVALTRRTEWRSLEFKKKSMFVLDIWDHWTDNTF